MKSLVIVHHHLNPGGVTRVIVNQLLALDGVLKQSLDVIILHGPGDDGWCHAAESGLRRVRVQRVVVPELAYDSGGTIPAEAVYQALRSRIAAAGMVSDGTVLQFHNHSLGKNPGLTFSVRLFARAGYRLVLQLHDFAEDFRAANYRRLSDFAGRQSLADGLYPVAGHVHYAVLNARDFSVMQRAGVPRDRLHLLPNPVLPTGRLPTRAVAREKLRQARGLASDRPFAVYPVRGIRRKNLGEMLLWAAALGGRVTTGMTLAPMNPSELRQYHRWSSYAERHALPSMFETGRELTFEENLSAADAILTTSVAEGFGMVFLESWLAGRTLLGRDLPEITQDFKDSGVLFQDVYERLDVPLEWIDSDRYLQKLRSALDDLSVAFRLPGCDQEQWDRVVDAKTGRGMIDFADLDEELQVGVIDRVLSDVQAAERIADQLSYGALSLDGTRAGKVQQNRERVQESYSLKPSGDRLVNLFTRVLSTPALTDEGPAVSTAVVLASFLDGTRLRLLRC